MPNKRIEILTVAEVAWIAHTLAKKFMDWDEYKARQDFKEIFSFQQNVRKENIRRNG